MADSFKFIHASDFHLDQPMYGLPELPAQYKSTLANAPYTAAEKVFDLAISERVDFLLLAGDLFDLDTSGPRPSAFLLSNFRRLDEKGIKVYWCSGQSDQPERWPAAIELPENVVIFSSSVVETIEHKRATAEGSATLATIFGAGFGGKSRLDAEFDCEEQTPFPIAFLHGDYDHEIFEADNIRYWALGGRHQSANIESTIATISYPGTTQGRGPNEPGPHGCKICRVDHAGKLRIQNVDTDSVRWLPQTIEIHEDVNLAELKDALGERAMKIAADTDILILIDWRLDTTGDFNPQIRHRDWNAELLDWLRTEFGQSDRGIWSVRLTVEPPKCMPASWFEEDTILGEFMRAIGRCQGDGSIKLALHEFLPNSVESDLLSGIGQVSDVHRDEILRAAALTGIEYLAAHREPTPSAEAA